MHAVLAFAWTIWKERNQRVFQKKRLQCTVFMGAYEFLSFSLGYLKKLFLTAWGISASSELGRINLLTLSAFGVLENVFVLFIFKFSTQMLVVPVDFKSSVLLVPLYIIFLINTFILFLIKEKFIGRQISRTNVLCPVYWKVKTEKAKAASDQARNKRNK